MAALAGIHHSELIPRRGGRAGSGAGQGQATGALHEHAGREAGEASLGVEARELLARLLRELRRIDDALAAVREARNGRPAH